MKSCISNYTHVSESTSDYYNLLDVTGVSNTAQRFNEKLHDLYGKEPDLVNRLRLLKQTKVNMLQLLKIAPFDDSDHIIPLVDAEIEVLTDIIRNPHRLYEKELPTTIIKWSGSQNDLTELIYALSLSHCLNNGNLELKEIVVFFEQAFNTKLPDVYLKFSKIRNRKKNRVPFLSKLIDILLHRMDNLDG